MQKSLRFGLIGYKFMGKAHADALARIPRFFQTDRPIERAVLCGRDADNVQAAARTLGFQETETDWRALIDRSDIDCVDITAPSNAHKEIAIAAAKSGKHIFCEKPLAFTAKDGREILKAAREAGVRHQIGFNYRFVPALILAKSLISEGALGRIFHVRGSFLQQWLIAPDSPKVWRLDKSVCGSGSLGDLGAHVIDAVRYLCGDMASVVGMSETFIRERPVASAMSGLSATVDAAAPRVPVDVDDATSFLCRFENGAMGVFEATRYATGHQNDMSIEINGDKGALRFSFERMNELEIFDAGQQNAGWRVVQASGGGFPYGAHWWPAGHVIGFAETFVHELYEFVQNVARGGECSPSFEDGVACCQVMDAVEHSIQTGGWATVSSF